MGNVPVGDTDKKGCANQCATCMRRQPAKSSSHVSLSSDQTDRPDLDEVTVEVNDPFHGVSASSLGYGDLAVQAVPLYLTELSADKNTEAEEALEGADDALPEQDEPEPAPEDATTEGGARHQAEPMRSVAASVAVIEDAVEENEEDVAFNATREFVKSLAMVAFVVLFWACLFGVLVPIAHAFDPPSCPKDAGDEIRSCEPCGRGTNVLPLLGEFEKSLPKPPRAVLHFVGLVWTFLGVGIVCDQFMAAIEEITSSEKTMWLRAKDGGKRRVHIKIWNPTVANLTLMALGSSAPEILLACIELIGNKFFSGALGPATIVGSAAFNLLIITAVCISAIPANETRKVACVAVFATTASVSVFAYAWLILVLKISSPNRVEIWEGFATFAMFPGLIMLAFAIDKGFLGSWHSFLQPPKDEADDKRIMAEKAVLEAHYGKSLSKDVLKRLVHEHDTTSESTPLSKSELRRSTMQNIYGRSVRRTTSFRPTIGFEKTRLNVLEFSGALKIKVVRKFNIEAGVQVGYSTREGTAKAGERFHHAEGTLRFKPFQRESSIEVEMLDDDVYQPDEHFFVHLNLVEVLGSHSASGIPPILGIDMIEVTVINDDLPGMLAFDLDQVVVPEGIIATLGVNRTRGHVGKISCQYNTEGDTAVSGRDFAPASGVLTFDEGQTHNVIRIEIFQTQINASECDEKFKVVLSHPSTGVKFDPDRDGGPTTAVCEVVIQGNCKSAYAKLLLLVNMDRLREGFNLWSLQFTGALYCNGSAADQAEAGLVDWFFHGASVFWKFLFAFIPPPFFCRGWFTFFVALMGIGAVTTIVGDMASLLGCCIGLPDSITAITLVALGTSLPDTVASRMAAQQDETADNSVGNVTGSNSVNVFLGLGLPWTMGAIYWDRAGANSQWRKHMHQGATFETRFLPDYPNGGFMVPAGTLSFSVGVFTVCALLCILLLCVRRKLYGGELGGPKAAQRRDSSVLVFLWVLYIAMSTIYTVTTDA